MRAIGITSFGDADQLTEMDVPVPEPEPEEVLIAVRAAGIGPWDIAQRQGWTLGDQSLPMILGWECAGVIERTGSAVTEFEPGDEVYAHTPARGNYAEYVAASAAQTAHTPESLSFDEAAAVPISGTTAHQAITEDLDVQGGETVLITAAAGGTGVFAVQLAARRGAHVIATASARNHELLRELGAHDLIDYSQSEVVASVRALRPDGVDCLLDCVGTENFERSIGAVRDNGRAVGIAGIAPPAPPRGVTAKRIYGRPDGRRLATLAKLIDAGELSVRVEEVLPLSQAARGHQLSETGHVAGKLILHVA